MIFILIAFVFLWTAATPNPTALILMNTELRCAHWTRLRLSFSAKAAAKIVHSASNGCVINLFNLAQHASVLAKPHAPSHHTENVHIHTPTEISECIPVFREIPNIGIISTITECILREQFFCLRIVLVSIHFAHKTPLWLKLMSILPQSHSWSALY